MEIEGLLAIIFIFGIPSIALATHLVFRPLLKDVLGARSDKLDQAQRGQLESRMAGLEDSMRDLDQPVHRLIEAEHFRRELEAGPRERQVKPEL